MPKKQIKTQYITTLVGSIILCKQNTILIFYQNTKLFFTKTLQHTKKLCIIG